MSCVAQTGKGTHDLQLLNKVFGWAKPGMLVALMVSGQDTQQRRDMKGDDDEIAKKSMGVKKAHNSFSWWNCDCNTRLML